MVSFVISIHAPREGSDLLWEHWENLMGQFLSTLPARGATWLPRFVWVSGVFLSTLPARGATLNNLDEFKTRYKISIHAPREGSDRRHSHRRR